MLLKVRRKMRVKEKMRERNDLPKWREASKHFLYIYSYDSNNSPGRWRVLLFPFYR